MANPLGLRLGERLPLGVFPARRDERLRESPRTLLFLFFLFPLICNGCGAVITGPSAPVTVAVTPSSAQPFQGENVQFNANVQNASSPAVNWQVNQTTGGNPTVGMIDSNGLYTAPILVPNPPTVVVSAVLQSDSTRTGSSSVTILSISSIQSLTLSPKLSSVTTSQRLQLDMLPDAVSNADVNWAVDGLSNGSPSVGTISTSGVPSNSVEYIAPPAAGSHLVTAILKENPGALGSATVKVTDFPGTLTWRNDNSRSGVNSQELALAPATVNSSTFGKLFSCPAPADGPLDGYVHAQPLYIPNLAIPGNGTHNVTLVATEKDSVYAFDADAKPCLQLWKQTALIPDGSQAVSNSNMDIAPFVGITGTPVIEASTSALYVVAATQTVALNPTYGHWLYALDLATGERVIQLAGVKIASPDSVFDSSVESQRPALLLDNGTVYIAFGSNGLPGDYHGWLFEYDSSTLQQTGAFNVTAPPGAQGGIWQSGGGPSADSNHSVFVVTGNGPFNANRTLQSFSYGDSFLRLETAGGFSVSDYFTPCDQAALETAGLDVGASAPVLLPLSAGSASQPNLLIGGSKGGSLYVVNRDLMGKIACPDLTAQTIAVGGTILSTPLFWNSTLYVAPGNENLLAFPMSGGILAASPSASQSPEKLGPQGATPVISSNGPNNAVLWLIDSSGALMGAPAILRAYDPNNLSTELYHSTTTAGSRDTAGPAVKFTVPTVANGKVYVGTQTELDVYGLLP